MCNSVSAHCSRGVHWFLFPLVDCVLRSLEDLSCTELVVEHLLSGTAPCAAARNEQQPILCRKLCPTCRSQRLEPPVRRGCLLSLSRIDALNYSLDPWERTDAVLQGWATSSRQWCLSRGISNCDQQGSLSLPSVPVAILHRH